jgi:hypothetical protein
VLDVEFKDDLSRDRSGHGAKNMASVMRRFAFGLIRANKTNGRVKLQNISRLESTLPPMLRLTRA